MSLCRTAGQKATLIGLALCLLSVGCGDDPKSIVEAVGTVHVDGKPLSGAVITFEPTGRTTGPNVTVPIFDGKFTISHNANLHGGKYIVRLSMIPAEIRNQIPPAQASSLPDENAVISPRFDAESTLTCDLKTGQENVLTFDVAFKK